MKPFAIQNESGGRCGAWENLTPVRGDSDYCSREGAMALKEKIEAYWRDRGHDVMIALHNVGFHPAIRAARYDLRSDMINGRPRATLKAQSRSHEPVQAERDEILLD